MADEGFLENGVAVELTENLTRYHPSLKAGSHGVTVPPAGVWSSVSGRFCTVKFSDITIEVQWRWLKVIDERVIAIRLKAMNGLEQGIRAGLKTAVKRTDARRGFKSLSITYSGDDGSTLSFRTVSKKEAAIIEQIINDIGFKMEVICG